MSSEIFKRLNLRGFQVGKQIQNILNGLHFFATVPTL